MPTEVIHTLKPSGGDYTSFVTALTDIALVDWVGTDQIPVIEFDTGTYSAGVNRLDERVTIDISNTDATHPVIIRPAAGHWGNGQLDSSLRVENNYSYNEVVKVNGYVKIYGLQTENHGSYGEGIGPVTGASIGLFRGIGMLVHGRYVASTFIQSNVSFVGCRFTTDNISGTLGTNYNTQLYNCLVDNAYTGYRSSQYSSLYTDAVNCTTWNNTALSYDQVAEFDANSHHNASSNYTAEGVPGANSLAQDVVAGDYTNAAGGDFSLSGSSALDGAGDDLSGLLGADWISIEGTPFDSANPPIGPYQPAAAATTLSPDKLSQSQSIDAASLTVAATLAPAALDQAQSIDDGSVGTLTLLVPVEINQAHTIDEGGVVTGTTIQPVSLDQAQSIDAGSIDTTTALLGAALDQSQTIDDGAISTGTTLAPVDINQGQTIDAGSISTDTTIQPAALDQAQTLDAGVVNTTTGLQPDALDQAQTIDVGSFSLEAILAPAAIDQTQTIAQGTLGTLTVLSGADIGQAQTIDGGSITTQTSIQPNELLQAQELANGALSTETILSGAELHQTQTLDATTLTINNVLPMKLYQLQTIEAGAFEGGTMIISVDARYLVDSSRKVYLVH